MGHFSIAGRVIKGDGVAFDLGYPTANLEINFSTIDLEPGVYVCLAKLKDKEYKAVCVFNRGIKKFEVHLIGYTGAKFYGEVVSVDVLEKLSNIEKMDAEKLLEKINDDMKKAFAYFNL